MSEIQMTTTRHIVVLEPSVANKIAAGEVVERPSSVVKELVENSLDAGATSVTVEIKNGGIEYIRVTDNGCGIPNEDVPTAFLRHATSKLSGAEGLDSIETLGFRGEALASIAAVSKVRLRTAAQDAESGTLITVNGGEFGDCAPCGCPSGTSIEVSELFYNVPARLKFLRSPRAEAAAVGDYVLRLILANTGVSIKYISNGKPVYHSNGDGALESALDCVYGSDINEHISPITFDDGYIRIDGFCGDAYLSRSTRVQQSIFLNGRYIRSQSISYAVLRAYDTRLMQGRFPFFALNIRISPREIDVNVHPNKLMVRFKDEERVCYAVSAAVRAAKINTYADVPNAISEQDELCAKDNGDTQIKHNEAYSSNEREPTAYQFFGRANTVQNESEQKQTQNEDEYTSVKDTPNIVNSLPRDTVIVRDSATALPAPADYEITGGIPHYSFKPINSCASAEKQECIEFGGSPYSVIGVAFDTYVIVQQDDALFLIDQHAAHERILYEKLISSSLRFEKQLMMSAMPIRLTPTEYAVVQDNIERFAELGFDIEDFGKLTINVHSAPMGIPTAKVERTLRDMIATLQKQGNVTELSVVRGALIQTACKHAVKAGDRLEPQEIEAILQCYEDGQTPMTCPHGRPVMSRLTRRDLEKLFKRVL